MDDLESQMGFFREFIDSNPGAGALRKEYVRIANQVMPCLQTAIVEGTDITLKYRLWLNSMPEVIRIIAGKWNLAPIATKSLLMQTSTQIEDPAMLPSTGEINLLMDHYHRLRYTRRHYTNFKASYNLVKAAEYGHLDIVQRILEQHPQIDVNVPLMYAAYRGQMAVVEFLLNMGAQDTRAFTWAARNGHIAIIQLMLTRFPPRNMEYDILLAAARRGHCEVVQLMLDRIVQTILERGRHFVYADGFKRALKAAAWNGHLTTVQRLFTAAVHLYPRGIPDFLYEMVMSSAAIRGHLTMVEWLLGLDINHTITDAMIKAASHGHAEIVQLLLDHTDQDPYFALIGLNGQHALRFAIRKNHRAVINVIINRYPEAFDTKLHGRYRHLKI